MTLEELNFDIRTYNAIKRAGIDSAEQLAKEVETEHFMLVCGRNAASSAAKTLKSAGIVEYIRGDNVPAEALGRELPFEELSAHIGEILAIDISTESHKWYRAAVIAKITDERILFFDRYRRDDGFSSMSILSYQQRHGNAIRSGGFFLIRDKAAPEEVAPKEAAPAEIISADEAAMMEQHAPNQIVLSDEFKRAVSLTRSIIANAQAAQQSMWEVCKGLNEMKEHKLYKELGYQTFEDYCEQKIGISRRQGQKYAAIAALPENGKLTSDFERIGVEKLYLLTQIDDEQREQIAETVDVESATVKQLKAQIEALKNQAEQVEQSCKDAEERAQKWYEQAQHNDELLHNKHGEWLNAKKEVAGLTAHVTELEEQVKELESRPVEVAVQTDTAALEQLQAAHQAEIMQLEKKHQEQLAQFQQSDSAEQISANIRRGQFDAKHSVMQTAAEDLMSFLTGMEMSGNPQAEIFIEKTKKTLRKLTNRLNEIIMEGENAE